MTELLTPKDVTKAVALLQAGQLVALPTETVYGLFGLALDNTVVEKVYRVKNRQHDHLEKLYNKFMPGSLTVILEANKRVPSLVNYGMPTVGFRMPDNQTTLEILRQTGPMVGPSANLTGNPSPKTAQDVLSDLSGQIAAVLKADESISGIDSTIVDLTGELPTILRQGALTLSEIYEVIKDDF